MYIIDRLLELLPIRDSIGVKGTRHAVIGAGIVGLALARQLIAVAPPSRVYIEADSPPQGASIRNFGTIWPVGQPPGARRTMAMRSLGIWRDVGRGDGRVVGA